MLGSNESTVLGNDVGTLLGIDDGINDGLEVDERVGISLGRGEKATLGINVGCVLG